MKQKRRSCKCWKEIKRGVFLSQLGHFLYFLIDGYFYKYEDYFDLFNQITLYLIIIIYFHLEKKILQQIYLIILFTKVFFISFYLKVFKGVLFETQRLKKQSVFKFFFLYFNLFFIQNFIFYILYFLK